MESPHSQMDAAETVVDVTYMRSTCICCVDHSSVWFVTCYVLVENDYVIHWTTVISSTCAGNLYVPEVSSTHAHTF